MNKTFLVFTTSFSLLSASALAGNEKITLGSKSFENTNEQSRYVYGKVSGKKKVDLQENFFLNLDAGLSWSLGREENKFESQADDLALELNDVSLNFKPFKKVTLSAGALAQHSSPFLTDGQSFPGLTQSLSHNQKNLDFTLKTTQAIPTSKSLNVDRSEKEDLPTFMTAGLEVTHTSLFKVSANYSYYKFENIPSVVAFESKKFGNTIAGSYAANAKNIFEYAGHIAGLKASYDYKNITPFSFYEVISNTEAPNAFDTGKRMGLGIDYLRPTGSKYSLTAEYFYNESDTAPAYYNSALYGHNNREGNSMKLSYTSTTNYSVNFQYVDSKVINERVEQSDQKVLKLEVEVLSDLI